MTSSRKSAVHRLHRLFASNLQTRIYSPRGRACSVEGCQKRYYGSGFCKAHHQWHWKRGLLPKPVTISIPKKIMASVWIDANDCWLWQKPLNNKGYGKISFPHSKNIFVHRASYECFVGPITHGLEVCHSCDVPHCVNPKHLFLATHQGNMADSVKKGRAKQVKWPSSVEAPRSILTAEQVAEIRSEKPNLKAIAHRLGVHYFTILRCKNRETYRDMP